jgi:hypothetical protein
MVYNKYSFAAYMTFFVLLFSGCVHTGPQTEPQGNGARQNVTYADRTKSVEGDYQRAFPSPDSGANDLSEKIVNIIRELDYSNHRFVLVGFRSGRDTTPNRFGEVLLESLTHALQRSPDIQLTADRTAVADVLNQLSLEISDVYDDSTVARLGRAVGATAILRVRMELMPRDRNITVYVSGIEVETALPLPGFSVQTLFDYSGDIKFLWDEDYNETGNLDFQIQLVGKKRYEAQLFPVTPNTSLTMGDGVKLWVRANSDVYLYVINLDASGNLNVMFPNHHILQFRNPIPAGTDMYLPPEKDAFYILDEHGAGGNEEIWWAVSREPRTDLQNLIQQISSNGRRITRDQWNRQTRGLQWGVMDSSQSVKKSRFSLESNPESLMSYHFNTADIIQGGIFSFRHVSL